MSQLFDKNGFKQNKTLNKHVWQCAVSIGSIFTILVRYFSKYEGRLRLHVNICGEKNMDTYQFGHFWKDLFCNIYSESSWFSHKMKCI